MKKVKSYYLLKALIKSLILTLLLFILISLPDISFDWLVYVMIFGSPSYLLFVGLPYFLIILFAKYMLKSNLTFNKKEAFLIALISHSYLIFIGLQGVPLFKLEYLNFTLLGCSIAILNYFIFTSKSYNQTEHRISV